MFERFTDRARRVVVLAQEEARLLGHDYVGDEHLLLGLIHEGDGIAAKSLASLGVTLDKSRDVLAKHRGGSAAVLAGHLPITPRAKKVLELSLREALQLGHNYIGTEHILLGIVRVKEGLACEMLMEQVVDLAAVRAQVIIHLSAAGGVPLVPPKDAAIVLTGQQADLVLSWIEKFTDVNGPLAPTHPLAVLRALIEDQRL